MASYASPGVYIREVDYSQYVEDASSCIVGIVGGARKGPIGIPTLITTQAQLIEVFGIPIEGEYGIYAALRTLTHCNQVYYCRVVREGTYASAGEVGVDKITYRALKKGTLYNGYQVEQSEIDAESNTFGIVVKDNKGLVVENFSGLSLKSSLESYAETVINSQSKYIYADVQYQGTYTAKTLTLGSYADTKGLDTGAYASAGVSGTNKILLRSRYFESDLNGASAIITDMDSFGFFNIVIVGKNGETIESFESLSMEESSNRYAEVIVNQNSARILMTIDKDDAIKFKAETMVFTGGDDGVSGLSSQDIIGELSGSGLNAFSNPETILIDLILTPGWSDIGVIQAGINIAENRSDCMYLIDPPFGLTPQQVINWSNGNPDFYSHSGFDSSYAALYWPWLKVTDSYSRKDIWLPPSGFVAGQYAYNDSVANPWNAPAGLNRGTISGVIAVEMSATQGERDALYGNRNIVNPIVNFISSGIIIWGQKTTQREPSALDRVNVRRLMNYLKRVIGTATRGFVFEQNVESTWERWKTLVDPILSNIQQNDGLYDYKLQLAPTAQDIENSRMPITVYVKPTKAAEFIPITFHIASYTASFDDINGY